MSNPDRKDKRTRRRRSGLVEITNALLSLVVLGLIVFGGLFIFGASRFYAPAVKVETNFTVERGSSVATTARRLVEQGLIPPDQLIPSDLVFRAGAWALRKSSDIKAGVYVLKTGYSMSDVLREITEGKPVDFFVNVIPGETSYQVASRLNDPAGNLTGDPVAVPAEGALLAIRYDFFPGDSRQSVLDAMQQKMQARLAEIWAARDPVIDDVIKSPAELVTLASIVEKETGLPSERPQVAAVFVNRLKKGMRLQTDPTVLYGVTGGKEVLSRSPTAAELKAETPYNTYQIDGLPAGPIANPGEDALLAAAHPAPTKDLYFVARSADPADGHLFAASYEEHRKNVAAYRKAAAAAEVEAEKEALEAAEAKEAGEDVPQETTTPQ